MVLSEQFEEIIGREIPLGAKWEFKTRISRWPDRMLDEIKHHINYMRIYENASRADVANFIVQTIKDLYYEFWGVLFDVSTSDCTIYLQDHGGNCYAMIVEGPGPNDIYIPFSFSLKLWPS